MSFYVFGKALIFCNQLFYEYLFIPFVIEQLSTKGQVFVRRKEKWKDGLSALIFELNLMNSDKIMDGTVGFQSIIIYSFSDNISIKR